MLNHRRKVVRAPVIAVVSPKGGVGKTTVSANLAAALVAHDLHPILVDLDAQNAARLHFGSPLDDVDGLAVREMQSEHWGEAVFTSEFGVDCVPFGVLSEQDRIVFEQQVYSDSDLLLRGLASLPCSGNSVIILDTPPGGSVFFRQAILNATIVLSVVLPDAASYVTVPTMERWLSEYQSERPISQQHYFLLNRMNDNRALSRDVRAALRDRLKEHLVPRTLSFDSDIEEALAVQKPVSVYAPDGDATRDYRALAEFIVAKL